MSLCDFSECGGVSLLTPLFWEGKGRNNLFTAPLSGRGGGVSLSTSLFGKGMVVNLLTPPLGREGVVSSSTLFLGEGGCFQFVNLAFRGWRG